MLKNLFSILVFIGFISGTGLWAQSDTVALSYKMMDAELGPCKFHIWKNDTATLHFTSAKQVDDYFATLTECKQKPALPEVDFTTHDVLLVKYNGTDCLAQFRFNLVSTHADKTVTFFITVIYGGCRAAGNFYEKWVVIPKISEGYKVKIQHGTIDTFGKYKKQN